MDHPKTVSIRYPDGFEQSGIAKSADQVEVGAIGTYVELADILVIDGVPRRVTGTRTRAESIPGGAPGQVTLSVTLTHEAVEPG